MTYHQRVMRQAAMQKALQIICNTWPDATPAEVLNVQLWMKRTECAFADRHAPIEVQAAQIIDEAALMDLIPAWVG